MAADGMYTIYLPKLNRLNPTLESTLLKAVEEAGELARAVLHFLPFQEWHPAEIVQRPDVRGDLDEVTAELFDVAQTCVTMIFVMEDDLGIDIDGLIDEHLHKLRNKGYDFDAIGCYHIATRGEFKHLCLPRLKLDGVTLLTTVCKIQEELGELTQYLGKRAGASGERRELSRGEVFSGCALELLDVAQCCFTMMYILAARYAVDMETALAGHVDKLRRKGYCSEESGCAP